MPSSMCWPCGENSQLKVDGMRSLLNVSAIFSRANRPRRFTHGPRLVETVTSGDVVTMRFAKSLSPRPISLRMCAEAGLRRHRRLDRDRQARPAPRHAAPRAGARSSRRTARGRETPAARPPASSGPRTCPIHGRRARSSTSRNVVHLRRRHQAGVVVLVAGDRQAEALHRVADEAGRLVAVRACAKASSSAGRSWPPRLFISAASSSSRALVDQLRHVALIADLVVQPLAPRRAALEHQRRVELVRAGVDPACAASRRPAP